MAIKYSARKYDGDDKYSWAIFRAADLKGLPRGIIFYGMAEPVMTGMDQRQALATARQYTQESKK